MSPEKHTAKYIFCKVKSANFWHGMNCLLKFVLKCHQDFMIKNILQMILASATMFAAMSQVDERAVEFSHVDGGRVYVRWDGALSMQVIRRSPDDAYECFYGGLLGGKSGFLHVQICEKEGFVIIDNRFKRGRVEQLLSHHILGNLELEGGRLWLCQQGKNTLLSAHLCSSGVDKGIYLLKKESSSDDVSLAQQYCFKGTQVDYVVNAAVFLNKHCSAFLPHAVYDCKGMGVNRVERVCFQYPKGYDDGSGVLLAFPALQGRKSSKIVSFFKDHCMKIIPGQGIFNDRGAYFSILDMGVFRTGFRTWNNHFSIESAVWCREGVAYWSLRLRNMFASDEEALIPIGVWTFCEETLNRDVCWNLCVGCKNAKLHYAIAHNLHLEVHATGRHQSVMRVMYGDTWALGSVAFKGEQQSDGAVYLSYAVRTYQCANIFLHKNQFLGQSALHAAIIPPTPFELSGSAAFLCAVNVLEGLFSQQRMFFDYWLALEKRCMCVRARVVDGDESAGNVLVLPIPSGRLQDQCFSAHRSSSQLNRFDINLTPAVTLALLSEGESGALSVFVKCQKVMWKLCEFVHSEGGLCQMPDCDLNIPRKSLQYSKMIIKDVEAGVSMQRQNSFSVLGTCWCRDESITQTETSTLIRLSLYNAKIHESLAWSFTVNSQRGGNLLTYTLVRRTKEEYDLLEAVGVVRWDAKRRRLFHVTPPPVTLESMALQTVCDPKSDLQNNIKSWDWSNLLFGVDEPVYVWHERGAVRIDCDMGHGQTCWFDVRPEKGVSWGLDALYFNASQGVSQLLCVASKNTLYDGQPMEIN